jgi:hypothetical protein
MVVRQMKSHGQTDEDLLRASYVDAGAICGDLGSPWLMSVPTQADMRFCAFLVPKASSMLISGTEPTVGELSL